MLISQETWKTQNQHQVDSCVFLEVKHLYQQVGCARNRLGGPFESDSTKKPDLGGKVIAPGCIS